MGLFCFAFGDGIRFIRLHASRDGLAPSEAASACDIPEMMSDGTWPA